MGYVEHCRERNQSLFQGNAIACTVAFAGSTSPGRGGNGKVSLATVKYLTLHGEVLTLQGRPAHIIFHECSAARQLNSRFEAVIGTGCICVLHFCCILFSLSGQVSRRLAFGKRQRAGGKARGAGASDRAVVETVPCVTLSQGLVAHEMVVDPSAWAT